MTSRTWIIIGATSLIAKQFAHLAAQHHYRLRLVGRNEEQLNLICQDISLRFTAQCDVRLYDLAYPKEQLSSIFDSVVGECDVLFAHSAFCDNEHLTFSSINDLIKTNVLSTSLLINYYLQLKQTEHNLIYLSSVAAGRGRAKNSLYGGTKAAIELYVQGLQQQASVHQHFMIARLGFIDTKQTYGMPGIFYAASPKKCARALWKAFYTRKRFIYFPKFWQGIMLLIQQLPFFIYQFLKR